MRPALELVKNYRGYTFKATRRAQRHYFIVLPTRDASVTVLVNGNMKIENVDYVGVRPNWGNPLRIAHAPNHPYFKGTRFLEEAVDRLRSEGNEIELIRVQGVSNAEALELFSRADIVADQFVSGFHGYTALEAMAHGKPVLCYLRDASMMLDPATCPIIRADPDTLYNVLKACLRGDYDLIDIGKRGRNYVEHYYSLPAVAARLGELYLETWDSGEAVRELLRKRIAMCHDQLPALLAECGEAKRKCIPSTH